LSQFVITNGQNVKHYKSSDIFWRFESDVWSDFTSSLLCCQ